MTFELDLTPDELPVPVKATNNMKVLHMDPLGKGTGVLPREISVQNTGADGALVYAMYSGFPAALAVDDYVICWSDDNDTIMRVAASGGSTAMNEGLLSDGTVVGATAQAQDFGSNGILADNIGESSTDNGINVTGNVAISSKFIPLFLSRFADAAASAAGLYSSRNRGTSGSPTDVLAENILFDLTSTGRVSFDRTAATMQVIADAVGANYVDGRFEWQLYKAGVADVKMILDSSGLTLDDGTGDSPSLKFVGGSNDDTVELFLEDDVTVGDSDLIVKLADAAGDSKLIVRDSADADVGAWDSTGAIFINGLISGNDTPILTGWFDWRQHFLGETVTETSFALSRWANSVGSPVFAFGKSRSSTIDSYVIVQNGDFIGSLYFYADDGTDLNSRVAAIDVKMNGVPGANNTPGIMIFSVTPAGASEPVSKMSISNIVEIEDSEAVTALQISNAAADGDPVIILALSGTPKITMGVDDGDGDDFKIGTTAIGTSTRLRIGGTNGELETTSGRIVNTTRITGATTLDSTHYMVFADTDAAAFPVTLPAGVEGTMYRITNVGTSGNDVTVDGNGAETVMGAVTQALSDGETMILIYNTTEGWW